mgnify:CR=1 FL=1
MEPFYVGLDNVTIVGDLLPKSSFPYIMANSILWGERYRAKYPYVWSWQGLDGSFLQYTDENKFSDIRIEFNPSKCEKDEIIDILHCLRNSRLTRVDVALDFEVDLREYKIFDSVARTDNMVRGLDKKIETYYFGSRTSYLFVRVYDKAREQKIKDGRLWWRFEATVKHDFIELFLKGILNPFQGLRVFKPNYKDLTYTDEAVIRTILEDESFLGRMEKSARSRYRKKITSMPTSDEIPIQDLFKTYLKMILYDTHKWLDYANSNTLKLK